MPKVHFFKLAQELGERPVELQKKLAAEGISIRSTSSMLDEGTAEQIRGFLRQEAMKVSSTEVVEAVVAASAVLEGAPLPAPQPTPTPTPESAVVTEAKPEPAPEIKKPVTRIIKKTAGPDGQRTEVREARPPSSPPPRSDQRRPQDPKKRNLLLTPESEGGLSPEAEFGIVKAAGIIPIAQPRPARPPQRDDRGGPRPGGPPRPDGPRPPRGPMPAGGTAAPPAPGDAGKPGGPGRAPAAGGAAKKKQKRTVFSEKDKTRLQKRQSDFSSTTIRSRRKRRTGERREEAFVMDEPVIITGPITVGELAERAHVVPAQVITQLIGMGVLATVNQMIQPEQALSVLEKLSIEALYESDMVEHASWRLTASNGQSVTEGVERPPVVTILGHVDHGKTTLLDAIRKTNVTAQEYGGITQHIGAYQVEINGKKISFLDTPGHAAFTAMRARGANLTDIAILVVAADDGIQPQTIEAIDHAKAAKVPIIVAINKIDVPDAQPDAVKQQLTGYGLVAEEWGGDTIMVQVSAKKGINLEQLLEMILLVAEVQDLHAVADGPARGAVVETKLDKQRGPVATMLVQEGTLRVGDPIVVGMVSGKIRAMADDLGRPLKEAGPSMPVEITGMSEVPIAGDLFEVVDDERKAREIAESRRMKARDERLQARVSLQNLSSMVASGVVLDLNIIVKTDVAGSIEAISQALSQLEHQEIRVNIIHAGVGDVTESDVLLASASQAIIVGFHVRMEAQARAIAEEQGIDVRLYQIIYDIIDDVTKAMVGMLAPVYEEAVLGHAEVRATFKVSRLGVIAGCYVKDGLIRRGAKIRVLRAGDKVFEGTLDSLKHLKEDVREMAQGFECGISLDKFNAWQEGDIIEAYIIKELRRETL